MTGTFTQRMPHKEVYTGDYCVNQKVETTVLGLQAKECQRSPVNHQNQGNKHRTHLLSQSLEQTNPGGLQPPEPRGKKYLLFKPTSAWHLVTAILGNKFTGQWIKAPCQKKLL